MHFFTDLYKFAISHLQTVVIFCKRKNFAHTNTAKTSQLQIAKTLHKLKLGN
nr:MAG TPA: hypothetical protein [Caudoviricetes sp.]